MNLIKNLYMFIPETFRMKIKYGIIGIVLLFVLCIYLAYIIGYMDAAQTGRIYVEALRNSCYCVK